MRIRYLTLMGIAAVLLAVAGCGGDDAESETDGQRRAETQTTTESVPETNPESTGTAEITGSVTERASAQVREDGLHLKVGRYKFDAASGVAPVGTTVEITTFHEEPSEVAAQGGNSRIAFARLSSKTALQDADSEAALTEAPTGMSLQNTGRGFTVDTPDGVQLDKPLHVSFRSNEYGGSLQSVGAGEPAPVLLREQGDGLVWGAPAVLSPDENSFIATFAKVGTFFEGSLIFANEAGGYMGEVADQMFTGGTPRPDCHKRPIETSDGGTVSVEAPPKTVWACLQEAGKNVNVVLTNDYPSPLIVRSDSPKPLQYPDGLSPGEQYALEYMRTSMGKEVLPAKGKTTLTFPLDQLPASIELSTDLDVASAMLYGTGLESEATSLGGPLLSTYSDAQGGMDCFDKVLREDHASGTACTATFAGKKVKTVADRPIKSATHGCHTVALPSFW